MTGTITAADVIGPAGQGIAAGEFAELLRAMRAGVDVRQRPQLAVAGGEMRGQMSTTTDGDGERCAAAAGGAPALPTAPAGARRGVGEVCQTVGPRRGE